MSDEIALSEAMEDLIQDALEHALTGVAEGGTLVPFVVYERGEEREMKRFLVQDADPERWDAGASVEAAQAFASGLRGRADRLAVAVDGRIVQPGEDGAEGEKVDCVFIDAFEAGAKNACRIGQCYEPASGGREFGLVGDPMLLAVSEPMW